MFSRRQILKCSALILISLAFLNCPKRMSVKTTRIEVIYLSSLLDDIQRPEPFLCSIVNTGGLKIGYLKFETPFMFQIFHRLGFYKLLNEVPLDFLITNYPIYEQNFLSIPLDLGYGIKNYEGVRFAICSQYRDSLTISDQVKIATIRERSDVLWVADEKILSSPPMHIDFHVRNRILQDTTIRKIETKIDTTLFAKLSNFKKLLNQTLETRLFLNNSSLSDYIFSKIKAKKAIDIMLYPGNLLRDNTLKNELTIADFLRLVACDLRFHIKEMTREEVNKAMKEYGYQLKGNITKKNITLIPDKEGEYLFDLIFY